MPNRMTKVWRVGITHYDIWLVEVNNFSPKDQWRKLCFLDIKSITHLMTVSDMNSLNAKDRQSGRTWNLPPLEWVILFHCRWELLSCLVTYSQHTDGKPASFHPLPLPPCPPSLSFPGLWLCPPALFAHPGDMAACNPEKLQCHVHIQTMTLLPTTWSVGFWPFLFD